jgi:hypothetical protein
MGPNINCICFIKGKCYHPEQFKIVKKKWWWLLMGCVGVDTQINCILLDDNNTCEIRERF